MDGNSIRFGVHALKAEAKRMLTRKKTMTATDTGARLEAIKKYAAAPESAAKVSKRSGAGAVKGMSNFRADSSDIEKMIRGGN